MIISSRTPDGVPGWCRTCSTSLVLAPSYPLGDVTCPRCGSLVIVLPALDPRDPVEAVLQPDTPENRRDTERVVAEIDQAWDDFRQRRAEEQAKSTPEPAPPGCRIVSIGGEPKQLNDPTSS